MANISIYPSIFTTWVSDLVYLNNTFHLTLANGAALENLSTFEDFFRAETTQSGMGDRVEIVRTQGATYNVGATEANAETVAPTINNISGALTLQFDQVFIVINGSPYRPVSFGSGSVLTGTNQIAVANNNLVAGDRVMITPEAGSTLPGGIDENTRYYVLSASGNNFTLSANNVSVVDITSTGSGNFWLRYANGDSIESLITFSPAQSISPGGNLRVDLVRSNDSENVL